MSTKYIFITGGVVSGLGKGIAAASIGALLEARGFKVTLQKFDPYINVDPGTMSPFQHGRELHGKQKAWRRHLVQRERTRRELFGRESDDVSGDQDLVEPE